MAKKALIDIMNWQFPNPFGVTKQDGCMIFVVSVPNAKTCKLKIYDSLTKQLVSEYLLKDEHCIGSVFSIKLRMSEISGDCYRYEAWNKEFIDPYARRIIGRDNFALGRSEGECFGTWDFEQFDWSGEQRTQYSYNDLLIYKLHVRGYTMNSKSGVRHKGTYRGIIEKIPYMKGLGINAVFLMPCVDFNEMINQQERVYGVPKYTKDFANKGNFQTVMSERPNTSLVNFWGYTTDAFFFAPKSSYASKPVECIKEFKTMVKALHQASIEVIMDMYFPKEMGPMMILECLRFWKIQYHIDGFRVNTDSSTEMLLATDPYLAKTKLLATSWNIREIYPKDVEPEFKNLAEYNEGFLSDVRRFLKSDEEQVGRFVERQKRGEEKTGVINYITDHNGFCLNDLYMYDIKHNMGNGENNHDGTDYNYSWNCGVEGPSKKKKVNELRAKMRFNALATLFLSQGTPMLLAGDEFANSQNGNNNAYCQDNEIGWVDWKKRTINKSMIDFVKQLIRLRKQHPVLHNPCKLRGMDYISCGKPDISFHGVKAWYPDYSNYSRTIGIMLCGEYACIDKKNKDQSCYLVFNMHWEPHQFDLPHLDRTQEWRLYMMTDKGFLEKKEQIVTRSITLEARTMAILFEEPKRGNN